MVVTRHDATIFPRLHLEPDSAGGPRDLLFDRVLADVPCSGDGTLRKNPDLWARWNPGLGVAEHFVQARILRRGLELLKVGGRLVYSTCSLNPVEDEAVICSVLAQCPEAVQLVDVSGTLPGLRTCPGVRCWRVMTKEGEWVASADEVPTKHLRCLRPSLFPPAADAFCPPLERCMRILPHHQVSCRASNASSSPSLRCFVTDQSVIVSLYFAFLYLRAHAFYTSMNTVQCLCFCVSPR